MRHQYAIDPEIQALLPPLSPEESATLRTLLVGERHCDDLTVLRIESEQKNVLGDGHNRDVICREEGVSFNTRLVKVADRAAALQWVINNQLGRRNLTDERRAYYRGKEYLNVKQAHGGDRKSEEVKRQLLPLGTTAEQLAAKHGVSERTVKNDAAFAAAVDALPPEVKESILNGTAPTTKSEVIAEAKKKGGGKRKGGKPPAPPKPCDRCSRIGAPSCAKCKEKFPTGFPREPGDDTAVEELTDAEGTVVPEHARPAFLAVGTLEGVGRECDALRRSIEEVIKGPAGRLLQTSLPGIQQKFKDIKGSLMANRPSHVCPYCDGKKAKKPCECCKGEGWVAKHIFNAAPKGVPA